MITNMNFILIVVILTVVQYKTFALSCHHCEFGRDGCGSSFNSKASGVIQLTSGTYSYCVKKVYASNNNAISRDGSSAAACAAGTITVTPSTTGTIEDGFTVHCCTTDYCNGAWIKSTSILLTLTVLTFHLLFH